MENTDKKSFGDRLGEYKGEFKKITWPTKPEVIKQTITVIITCAIIGVIIFGMDFSFNAVLSQFISLVG